MRKKTNTLHKIFSKLFSFLLSYFFDPLFFISALGPLIVGSNYFMIAKLLTNDESNLKAATENPYTYALISYNIQYFVFIIVFIFFISETALAYKSLSRNLSLNQIVPAFRSSHYTEFMLILFFGVFCFVIYGFIKGTFAQIDINLYLKEKEVKIFSFWEPTWPPFKSAITQYRFAFIAYAILLSIWKNKTLPKLISASTRNNPSIDNDS